MKQSTSAKEGGISAIVVIRITVQRQHVCNRVRNTAFLCVVSETMQVKHTDEFDHQIQSIRMSRERYLRNLVKCTVFYTNVA